MYRPLILFIALRYIFGTNKDNFGRFVSWLSMLGLMLGAMALIIVLSVMNGLEQQMQTKILHFLPQAIITTKADKLNPTVYHKETLSYLHGVEKMTPLVSFDIVLQSSKSIAVTQLMGVAPNENDPISPYILSGTLSNLVPGQYRIILGSTLAEQLQLKLGDNVRLITPNVSQFTPIGNIPNQRMFTVSGVFSVNKDINQSLVFVNIHDAAKLVNYASDEITGWRLTLTDPLSIEKLTHQRLPNGLYFKDWRAARGELFTAIKLEKKMMGLLISLIVIVAAFNIITSLSLLVMEKQGEVAILKTQGLCNKKLMILFMLQGATASIIGTLFGAVIGVVIALNLSTIMNNLHLSVSGIILPVFIDPMQVTMIVIALIAISVLATLYPSWHAAKMHPAEVLRYE